MKNRNIIIIIMFLSAYNLIWAMSIGQSTVPQSPNEFIIKYQKASPYEILGVNKGNTPDEIKKAFRVLALKWHPDKWPKNQEAQATEAFKILNAAYEKLINPPKVQPAPAAPQPNTAYQPNFINLGFGVSPLNLNQQAYSELYPNKTFGEILELKKTQNLPLIIALVTTDTYYGSRKYSFTLVPDLSKNSNLGNFIAAPRIHYYKNNKINFITYYFINLDNSITHEIISYPTDPQTFYNKIFRVIDNLSQEEIHFLVNEFYKINTNLLDANILIQLLKNPRIITNDKLFIIKILLNPQFNFIYSNAEWTQGAHIIFDAIINLWSQPTLGYINFIKTTIANLNLISIEKFTDYFINYKNFIPNKKQILVNIFVKWLEFFSTHPTHVMNFINKINNLELKNNLLDIYFDKIKEINEYFMLTVANTFKNSYPLFAVKIYEYIPKITNVNMGEKAKAFKALGEIYYKGAQGIEKKVSNTLQAYEYILRELSQYSDLLSNVEIHFTLGEIYKNGAPNVEKNYPQAVKNFDFVVNTKIPNLVAYNVMKPRINFLKAKANLELGQIYLNGGYLISKDLTKAQKYFKNAIKINIENVPELVNLKLIAHNFLNQIQTTINTQKVQEQERKKLARQANKELQKAKKRKKPEEKIESESEEEHEEPASKKQNIQISDEETETDTDTDTDTDEEM